MVDKERKHRERTAKKIVKKLPYNLSESSLFITVSFRYEKINSSSLKNIKRFFLKVLPQKTKDAMNYDRVLIYPLDYSYIKRPVSITLDFKNKANRKKAVIRNIAQGMVIEYEYLGLDDHWHDTIKNIKKIVRKMVYGGTYYSKCILRIKYSIGFSI